MDLYEDDSYLGLYAAEVEDDTGHLLGQLGENLEQKRTRLQVLGLFSQIALYMSILVLIIFTAVTFLSKHTCSCLQGHETIYDDAPKEYETVRFQRAGFHDRRHNNRTIYEGRPDAINNAAWSRLMSVGVISISGKENEKLSRKSAIDMSHPQEYIVELEMFHQLHCLKSLRQQLWGFEDGTAGPGRILQREQHFDHCIDYLRQAIMCHGDLTPITFEWNVEIQSYLARHTTEHRCRSFEKIFEWAEGRNGPDISIDANHENKELSLPEISD